MMFSLSDIILGFLIGLIATGIMLVENFFVWKKWGLIGVLEWHESQVMFQRIFKKKVKNQISIGGLLIHYVNGGLLAIPLVFSVYLVENVPSYIILGVIYSIFVWILTLATIHRPLTGESILNHSLGRFPVLWSIFGHILYGLALGFLIDFFYKS